MVRETSSDEDMAKIRVKAMGPNTRPTNPPIKRRGIITMTMVDVPATLASIISLVPSMAALLMSLRSSWWCLIMFSTTTMASSTTMPTLKIMADMVIRLRDIPATFISPKVHSRDRGMDRATMTDSLRATRKRSTMRAVKINASLVVSAILPTTCLVKMESSSATAKVIPG